MQLVIDSGADLSPEQQAAMGTFHTVPLFVTLDGETYRSGADIDSQEFFALLEETDGLPVTAQPSPIDFANMFRKLAATDPDILCVLMSSGLSGTVGSARAALPMAPEANITLVDTKTVSGATGWQAEAAGRAIRAGWELPRILELLRKVHAVTTACYTIETLRYLGPGGRITAGQAFFVSLFNIKPVIRIDYGAGRLHAVGAGDQCGARDPPDGGIDRRAGGRGGGFADADHSWQQSVGGGAPARGGRTSLHLHLVAHLSDGSGAGGALRPLHGRFDLRPIEGLPGVTLSRVAQKAR